MALMNADASGCSATIAESAMSARTGDGLPHERMLRLIDGAPPLAVYRGWRGLSQAELARRAGVSRVQIVEIEAGRATGSVATLVRLADALAIPLDDLVPRR